MRFLITRPMDDATETSSLLARRSIQSVIEPLISIEITEGPVLDLDGVQALLITSANGVRAFCQRSDRRDIKVMAVGDTSAHWARRAGFSHVESAGGDVDDLAEMVEDRLDPPQGALIHVAGGKVAGDLAGMLEDAGFTYRREVLYEARKVEAFTPMVEALFRNGDLDGVMLYSPRTAATFIGLMTAVGLAESCGDLTAFCLSANVAAEAEGLYWKRVVVAEKPEQSALMVAIDRWREDPEA